MQKRKSLSFLLGVVLVLVMGANVMAQIPPPPVNQFLGIYDTYWTNLATADCVGCHISDEALVQRHHALITSQNKQCLDCHVLVADGTGGFVFQDFRTCSACHTTTPHHTTTAAQQKNCKACHGSLVDNPNDGHYIPSYPMSSVTPLKDGRSVLDPATGQTIIVQGCEACHQADPTAVNPLTNRTLPIASTYNTHHREGLDCLLCHPNPHGVPLDIRVCQACHGVKSLHNIQKNSPAIANPGTIVPGQEEPGWGHIGANWDCNGCHWSWVGNSTSVFSTATVPIINNQSSYILSSGSESVLTINGESFTNSSTDGNVTYNPVVAISNGVTSLTLQPFSITVSEIKVIIPPLEAGNYDLRVMKDDMQSNISKLTIVPPVVLKSAVLGNNKSLTITGSGFGVAPATDYTSGLGVFSDAASAKIISWSNTKIVASSPTFAAGKAVTVKTVYGTFSKTVTSAAKKSR